MKEPIAVPKDDVSQRITSNNQLEIIVSIAIKKCVAYNVIDSSRDHVTRRYVHILQGDFCFYRKPHYISESN